MTRKFGTNLVLTLALATAFAHAGQAQSAANPRDLALECKACAAALDSAPAVPGTMAMASLPAPKLQPKFPFQVSVEPGYLPSWERNGAPSLSRYGAAPAVVTLTFSRRDKDK